MTIGTDEEKHKEYHEKLFDSLNELLHDYCYHTDTLTKNVKFWELMTWAYGQTLNPTPTHGRENVWEGK